MHTPKHHHKVLHFSQFAHQGVLRVYPKSVPCRLSHCEEGHMTLTLVAPEYDRSYRQALGWHGFRPKARDPTLL